MDCTTTAQAEVARTMATSEEQQAMATRAQGLTALGAMRDDPLFGDLRGRPIALQMKVKIHLASHTAPGADDLTTFSNSCPFFAATRAEDDSSFYLTALSRDDGTHVTTPTRSLRLVAATFKYLVALCIASEALATWRRVALAPHHLEVHNGDGSKLDPNFAENSLVYSNSRALHAGDLWAAVDTMTKLDLHGFPHRFVEIYQRGCELMTMPVAALSKSHRAVAWFPPESRIAEHVTLTPEADLDPYYVNQRRISMLVGAAPHAQALRVASTLGDEKQRALATFSAFEDLLKRWLLETKPPSFEAMVTQGTAAPGTCFTVFRDFYCKGLRVVGGSKPNPVIHAKYPGLARDGSDLKIELRVNVDHLMPGSPGDLLSGRVSDLFIVAVVHEQKDEAVICVPIFIGRVQVGPKSFPQNTASTSCELVPEAIDSFARIRSQRRPPKADLDLLQAIPEEDIKRAFADVIGEEHVPKDWGGERSDLFTAEVVLEGERTPTAFVFKGPAQFREMTLAQLGKNGDQLMRLATEPADLLVVQHCHRVAPQVRMLMRALCNQVGSTRRFTIIDGLDTLRFLRAYRKCGF